MGIAVKKLNTTKSALITYWTTTAIIALQVLAGAYFDLTRFPAFSQIAQHLGYPAYLLTVLGVLRILAFIVLLAPRLPRLKEWAYAGLFFEYALAVVSHITVGDGASAWIPPLMFIGLLITSWRFRPLSRVL